MIAGLTWATDNHETGASPEGGRLILVVEDDDWIRSLLAELLADEGYRVLEAADGDAALRLAAEHVPDVIVLDLRLPGKSGLDVLAELRAAEATASTPVLVLSGEVDELTRRVLACKAQRADGVMEKPLDLGEFFQRLEEIAEHRDEAP
jgi:DNA-binding response OmpR family regulator